MIQLQLLLRFLKYYWQAQTSFAVHSPFVFNFIQEVLDDTRQFYAFEQIEHLRKELKKDTTLLPILDYGAGSKVSLQPERKISSLARHSAVGPYTGQILFRLINRYRPKTLLELGTSLGISALYQTAAAQDSNFTTIEGSPAIAQRAEILFQVFKRKNIHLLTGPFDTHLSKYLEHINELDFLFIDGNHTYEASLRYFQSCLAKAHSNSIFVIGDIHWSEEMENAWQEMKAHSTVTLSIDLFYIGILFFRNEQKVKEEYTLIPKRFAPWKIF